MNMSKRALILISIIVGVAAFRFLPFPPNFVPIAALALFGGAFFKNKLVAILLPLGVLFTTDLIFEFFVPGVAGIHASMLFVYASFVLIALMGGLLKKNMSILGIGGASLSGSVLFFLITNLGSWIVMPLYPMNFAGLMSSYAAGIPFFHYTLLGDLFFNTILFGSAFMIAQKYPQLLPVKSNN